MHRLLERRIKERIPYLVLVILTMVLGLLSRADFITLPTFLANYAGDTIWAMMVFWGVRFLLPKQPIIVSVLLALGFAYLIELSQLYHAAWIDGIRNTKIGGLILGFGFKFSDLVCYFVGIALGALINLVGLARLRLIKT